MQFWSSSSDVDRLVVFFFCKYCTTVHLTRVDGVVKVCLSLRTIKKLLVSERLTCARQHDGMSSIHSHPWALSILISDFPGLYRQKQLDAVMQNSRITNKQESLH